MSRGGRGAALRGHTGILPHWIGRPPTPWWRRLVASRPTLFAVLVGLLAAGLTLASLRVDLIRVRYALADALASEAALRTERAELLAEVRRLRDPARLGALAAKAGLARPERVIELAAPETP